MVLEEDYFVRNLKVDFFRVLRCPVRLLDRLQRQLRGPGRLSLWEGSFLCQYLLSVVLGYFLLVNKSGEGGSGYRYYALSPRYRRPVVGERWY